MPARTAPEGAGRQSGTSLSTPIVAETTLAAGQKPLPRRWLAAVFACALVLCFVQAPGLIAPDTKLDLTANPLRFLARAANLWNSELPFGQAQNQAYGYLFPHGAFFLIGHVVGLPGWVTQRLWWALLLTAGFWGLLRVAETLGIGTRSSRLVGAAAFALSPRVLTTLGSISSETLPMMLAPWVLLPVILALRGDSRQPLRVLAARAGIALALMGAVNAVASLAACLPAVIWWACHRPCRRWRRFTAWWVLASALAVAWWAVALVLLGRISPPFLDFIESSGVTTQWTSLTELLRGTSAWTPFVAPTATAASSLVTQPVMVLATTLVAAGGLAGLALQSMPVRGRLVSRLLSGVALLAAGYSGGLGSPLAHAAQQFLDAGGAPLRNVGKLEPVIRIPIALGVAHLLGRIPLPGSASRRVWIHSFAHPENDRRVAAGIVVLTALAVVAAIACVAWVIWEITEKSPMVDLSLLGRRNFALGTLAFCCGSLRSGGNAVIKSRHGSSHPAFVDACKARFRRCYEFKPPASRTDSSETYVIGLGFTLDVAHRLSPAEQGLVSALGIDWLDGGTLNINK